ncbi:MAG: hypothetical protein KDK08_18400 [Rhizobiaceae bacterium]|nr:hypothetical protein [Rhizobiaceae bacterium]
MVTFAFASIIVILTRLSLVMAALLALAMPHPGMVGSTPNLDMTTIHAGTAHDGMADGKATHDLAAATLCAQACGVTSRADEVALFTPTARANAIVWFGEPSGAWPTTDPAPAFRPPNLLHVA